MADRFARAYRNYCWPVESLRDIRIAPFHVMATEGAVHVDKEHVWHMDTIASFVDSDDGLLMKTPYQVVDLANPASEAAATEWWIAPCRQSFHCEPVAAQWRVWRPESFSKSGASFIPLRQKQHHGIRKQSHHRRQPGPRP